LAEKAQEVLGLGQVLAAMEARVDLGEWVVLVDLVEWVVLVVSESVLVPGAHVRSQHFRYTLS
jgi:hypothetical protein